MPIDEAALAAAVDKGISDAAPNAAPPDPIASTGGNDDGEDQNLDAESSGADDPSPDGEGDGQGAPAGATGEQGAALAGAGPVPAVGEGVQLGPDGKPLAVDGKTTPEGKPADPLNDPLPNALKKETKERFNTVIGMVKETTAKLETVTAERNDILDAIVSTGATPVQYKQSLDYLRLVNSPSREDKKQALSIMQSEIRALATMIGEPVPGVNFLEGHQDLIDAVGRGQMTHQHAMELAAARANMNRTTQIEEQTNKQTQEQQRYNQAVADGRQALNLLGASLKADPHYAYKCGVLAKTFPAAIKRMHPSQWADAFKEAYAGVPAPVAPTPRPTPPNTGAPPAGGGGNTPLRATNPAGGQQPAPSSLAEAIDFGIKSAR